MFIYKVVLQWLTSLNLPHDANNTDCEINNKTLNNIPKDKGCFLSVFF